ncbi:hypothetical protein DSO57_1016391 [Entomophthora muscae]|uniref:Uncharacterized protein n=1 Tax=Entomophthora muscae TaxID=34485 RepID=A0ACC2S6N3_9FUNG|nr:hypothetical protein DSO57_1016391 [Entomophthora muscae]
MVDLGDEVGVIGVDKGGEGVELEFLNAGQAGLVVGGGLDDVAVGREDLASDGGVGATL